LSKPILISADSHVIEPPDLWTSRLPAKFKDRAPQQERMELGDAWAFPGTPPFAYGLNQCGGLPPEKYSPWVRWEDVRPEAHEIPARTAGQTEAGVIAEVMYPTPRVAIAMYAADSDPEYHLALVRAYNNWLSDYCSADPNRYVGLALAPSGGDAKASAAEVARALKLPGMRGVQINKYPTTGQRLHADDDAVFRACAEAGSAVHIHVGLAQSESSMPKQANEFTGAFTGCFRFYDPPIRMAEMIYTGLLDRIPELQVVWAEVDVGWVPYLLEQLDDRIVRQNPANRVKLKKMPGDYFRQNFHYTVVKDRYGIRNRDAVGVDRIMWSSDFPHATCDYPDYAGGIAHDFAGVPADELQLMLSGNAAKLYGLEIGGEA
jgi:predicted TIM-barrel fold metal-dependent hydrolase